MAEKCGVVCPFETLQRVGWTIQAKRDHVRMRNREMKYRLDMHKNW